jgi:hypothetical protein
MSYIDAFIKNMNMTTSDESYDDTESEYDFSEDEGDDSNIMMGLIMEGELKKLRKDTEIPLSKKTDKNIILG